MGGKTLTEDEKQHLFSDGYTVVRGLIGDDDIEEFLRAINTDIGSHGMDPEKLDIYDADSYCPRLRENPHLLQLINDGEIFGNVETFLGHGNALPISQIQFALRFPQDVGKPVRPLRGHIDGRGTGANGIPIGTYVRNFTVLCVVLLSDLPEHDMGNFTVFPGSHIRLEDFFKRYGHEDLGEKPPEVNHSGSARQIIGRTGDVVFAHHMLSHCAANNLSRYIRYAVILRFRHKLCTEFNVAAFTDMWREWEGFGR